ncbi:hypothetical protein Misp01_36190 [Microtetraspora sp. NBRC 13810]|uniref:GntR family transcriptional regulator n=1 Tax=Microtetraspora sp. NBRC 13810 TaxID=3030990 RepID=UPI0024A253E0|nr:GntR family transcriptional regulator [Microtetraspora sp. NBRC 13810]GLW08489.1 hypothetical protein Misp01_36190 [Microtetraspora sp. NBRC 13810]
MMDYEADTYRYIQIADVLRRHITDGELAAGEPLLSEVKIQERFGVARTTARRAVKVLRDEGLVYTLQGEGAFVGPPAAPRRSPRTIPMYQLIAREVAKRIASGAIKPRRGIPSEKRLMDQYAVARETARRAVALLREQGWVYTVPQLGSFASLPEKWPVDREDDA